MCLANFEYYLIQFNIILAIRTCAHCIAFCYHPFNLKEGGLCGGVFFWGGGRGMFCQQIWIKKFSVSDMDRNKYSESTLCLKNYCFVATRTEKNSFDSEKNHTGIVDHVTSAMPIVDRCILKIFLF